MGFVLVVFGALVPIATTPAAQLNAVFPSLDAIVLITDLITASAKWRTSWHGSTRIEWSSASLAVAKAA